MLRFVFALLLMTATAVTSPATTLRPPPFAELVQSAGQIVRGEVTAVRSEWRGAGEERRIVTLVTFRIEETVVGATTPSIELELLGGQVGTRRLEVSGMPRFAVGDRDILFIQNNGRQLCPLVTMGHGRYLIADASDGSGGQIVARANGVPLASPDEVALPLIEGPMAGRMAAMKRDSALTPAAFTAAIRAEATRLGRSDVVPALAATPVPEVQK